MEYACVVWFPYAAKDINLLEAVQKQALHWAYHVAVTRIPLPYLKLFPIMIVTSN